MSATPRRAPSDLEARIDSLSASQRAALASRLAAAAGRAGPDRGSGGSALVAFVTVDGAGDEPAPTPAELRSHLQELVPGHMIPSSIRLVDRIPRLPNGKIDVSALADLPDDAAEPGTDWVPPRTDVERKLAEIWSEVLGLDVVGVHDAFFELGGDSISSIHMTSRANQMGLGLSPNDVFNFPTIAELATRCAASRPAAEIGETGAPEGIGPTRGPSSGKGASRPPLFMVQWGAREATLLRRHLDRDQPLYSFPAHWHGARLELDATVEQMAAERLAELRSLQPSGPYLLGGYSMGVPIALEMARRLRHEGERVSMLFVLDPPHRNREEEAHQHAPPRTLGQKMSRQLRTLSDLKPAEWLRHLRTETRAQVHQRVWEPLRMVRVAAMRRLGLDVPEAQWHRYVGTIYTRARSRYAYPPYEGDVVIFSATDAAATETLSSWRELVRGRLHVETFEGAHLDFTMDAELFARWATRLGAILADGQMDTGDGAGESTLRVARPAEGAADDRGVSEDRQRRAVIGTHG